MTRRICFPALAAAAIFLLSTAPSFAESCTQWQLGSQGRLVARQDNQWIAQFDISQKGSTVRGQAQTWRTDDIHNVISGSVKGTLVGSKLQLRASWIDGSRGLYTGTIDDNGAITGATWDKANPNVQFRWVSDDGMRSKCVSHAVTTGIDQPEATPIPIPKAKKKGIDQPDGVTLPKQATDTAVPLVMATANQDTDIYTGPGGQFEVLAILRDGEQVIVLGQQDGWTKIKYQFPPNNAAWVWGEHVTLQ